MFHLHTSPHTTYVVDSFCEFPHQKFFRRCVVLLDVHAANNDQRNAVACSIASSHGDLHGVTSISACVDLNSQSVVANIVTKNGLVHLFFQYLICEAVNGSIHQVGIFICGLRYSFANVDIPRSVPVALSLILNDRMSICHLHLWLSFFFLSLDLSVRLYALMLAVTRRSSLTCCSDSFSTFVVVWFDRLHNLANLQCGREPRCLPTNTQNLLGSAFGVLSATILGNGVPLILGHQ